MSIELSWEEVRPYICKYFDILEEESRVARYTGNAEGLSSNRYNCIFFVARLGHDFVAALLQLISGISRDCVPQPSSKKCTDRDCAIQNLPDKGTN